MLIVAPNDREVRIEIGDALSVMFPDSAAERIIDRAILPSFREGWLSAGILAGANAMIYQVTKPLLATESSDYSIESKNSGGNVERSNRLDLSWLRADLPSQGQVLAGVFILVILFVLYKVKAWRMLDVDGDGHADFRAARFTARIRARPGFRARSIDTIVTPNPPASADSARSWGREAQAVQVGSASSAARAVPAGSAAPAARAVSAVGAAGEAWAASAAAAHRGGGDAE